MTTKFGTKVLVFLLDKLRRVRQRVWYQKCSKVLGINQRTIRCSTCSTFGEIKYYQRPSSFSIRKPITKFGDFWGANWREYRNADWLKSYPKPSEIFSQNLVSTGLVHLPVRFFISRDYMIGYENFNIFSPKNCARYPTGGPAKFPPEPCPPTGRTIYECLFVDFTDIK